MAFVDDVIEVLNSGDPLVKTWPLVDSYWLPFVMTFMYVMFVKSIGPRIMRNRKAFYLRRTMVIYNFCIVFLYTIALLISLFILFSTDALMNLCRITPVERGSYTYPGAIAGWIIYTLKYVEFADTVFFVLRKKNHLITHLHVIHHAALPIGGWLLLRTERSGFQMLPTLINAFMHILMYSYYGLRAMGSEMHRYLWWKEHLTTLQMTQFILILVLVLIVAPLTGCTTTKHGLYMIALFAIVFLILFCNFYIQTYVKPEVKGSNHQKQIVTQNRANTSNKCLKMEHTFLKTDHTGNNTEESRKIQ